MNWLSFLTPWTIAGGLFGVLLATAVVVSLVLNRRQIGAALARAFQRLFSPVGFFGLVIVVFLCISVLESGQFFNTTITHGAFFGLLGYALALGFDLVSVVCIQARLNATRLHDERGARLNLAGVCLCAAVSAFANICGSLQAYNPLDLSRTPPLLQAVAPWLSMIFPTMIIVLSMTSDHILDHLPARGIDVDTYRARERKRVELLQVRLETERALLTLEQDLAAVRTEREHKGTRTHAPHPAREWIWMRWLRPVVTPAPSPDAHALLQGVQATQAALAAGFAEVQALHPAIDELCAHLRTLRAPSSAPTTEPGPRARADSEEQARTEQVALPTRTHHTRNMYTHRSQSARLLRTSNEQAHGRARTTRTEPGAHKQVSERILTAFRNLGTNATDTDVAQASGYSRTTIARWRKRLTAQGQLPLAEEQTPSVAPSPEPPDEPPAAQAEQ